jgi:hypothetical protein
MGLFASQSSPKQTKPTKLFDSHPNHLLEVTGKRDFLCLKQLSPLGFLHSPGGGRWGKTKKSLLHKTHQSASTTIVHNKVFFNKRECNNVLLLLFRFCNRERNKVILALLIPEFFLDLDF